MGLELKPLPDTGPERAPGIPPSEEAPPHLPWFPSEEGIRRAALERAGEDLPRGELSRVLVEYQEELGAPRAALEAASRIGEEGALVVVAGQQPLPFGGPLFVLYKAWTAVALARRAESLLGRPVVPLFWNASEDHDLDEIGRVGAPGPGGERILFRAPLEKWRGRPASAIPGEREWREAALAFLDSAAGYLGAGPPEAFLAPGEGETWARWFSRILSTLLGPLGLVLVEPCRLRLQAVPLMARALERWKEVRDLLEASFREKRAGGGGPRSFPPLEGPPLFLDDGGVRRRILAEGKDFRLKGKEGRLTLEELLSRLEERPCDFSCHAALRPLAQNTVLPVLAQVVGPGEASYMEELYRFHRSPLGAGRRMPLLWPRLSASLLDPFHGKIVERFGLAPEDLFLPLEELRAKAVPGGEKAARVRSLREGIRRDLAQAWKEVSSLAPTLEGPFRKTSDQVSRALERLEKKVAAAESEAAGFAPAKVERLARWVRPGGIPQERAFAFFPFLPLLGEDGLARVVRELDVLDFRHRVLWVRSP